MSDIGRVWGMKSRLAPTGTGGAARRASTNESDVVSLPEAPENITTDVFCTSRVKRFGSTAVDLGYLSAELLQRALDEQAHERAAGRPLTIGELCLARGYLTREQVAKIAATRTVEIHFNGRLKGHPALMTWVQDFKDKGLQITLCEKTAGEIASLRENAFGQDEGRQEDIKDLGTLMEGRDLFIEAARLGASDVTILVGEKEAEVQIRVNGGYMVAREYSMKRDEGKRFAQSIYTGISTEKDSYNQDDFQHAQVHGSEFPGSGLSSIRIFRGPKYPFNGCTFIAARLQYDPEKRREDEREVRSRLKLSVPAAPPGKLELPGYTRRQFELVEELLRLPSGMVISTGPTGSGKTTSLYAFMKEQQRIFPTMRQVTIETPPEYPQPWAIQLSTEKKNPMEAMVAHTLRMDPDITLIGEIRSKDEAVAAVQAAQTGQFVWATMHVTSGYDCIARLTTLDHERLHPDLICNADLLVAFLSQRLVGCLCPKCSRHLEEAPGAVPDYMMRRLRTWANADEMSRVKVKHKPRAGEDPCEVCGGQGIMGRTAVAEIVLTSEELMHDIRHGSVQEAARNHRVRKGSDRSMLENGLDLVFKGQVDPVDLHKEVASIVDKVDGA